jgi:hypothetical protein
MTIKSLKPLLVFNKQENKMKIAILGSTGFVGKVLVAKAF